MLRDKLDDTIRTRLYNTNLIIKTQLNESWREYRPREDAIVALEADTESSGLKTKVWVEVKSRMKSKDKATWE
jgi:hypothetical protein